MIAAALLLVPFNVYSLTYFGGPFARSSGTDCLCRRELGVGSPANMVPTVGKVEGELCELLRVLLVEACFQGAPHEAM